MERRNEDLNRKMDHAKQGAEKVKSRAIGENAELIAHCNELRKASPGASWHIPTTLQ